MTLSISRMIQLKAMLPLFSPKEIRWLLDCDLGTARKVAGGGEIDLWTAHSIVDGIDEWEGGE